MLQSKNINISIPINYCTKVFERNFKDLIIKVAYRTKYSLKKLVVLSEIHKTNCNGYNKKYLVKSEELLKHAMDI